MKSLHDHDLPGRLQKSLKKALKMEWITVFYLISVVILMYLVMGSSQAMKTAWLEDLLSLVPSIAFIIANKVNKKKPNHKFPYGYHRVFSITFLTGAVALLAMGIFLVYDSSMALIKAEHPTIGNKMFFGYQVWMGWIMILALLYSAIPAMILGFKKLPIAKKLHNKLLYTDASGQKADYMTAFAAIVGILGVGAGFWWADAAAALVISFSILHDGYQHVTASIQDLMDRYPRTTDNKKEDHRIAEVKDIVKSWDWVKDAKVRFREHGQVYLGEIAVVPHTEATLDNLDQGYEILRNYHWKIHDFSIAPVKELPKWE
ncbi:cation diffusion facilitator family transporter [Antarcticibacterium arcticum]|uniref:Cation diffusion facilitator family transporter n=1 Tax=Antarcticibacterium arcticum TaxID=2585771 RepID=A0A5B8YLN4_9FLAO|nr:cation diffusion facilitator family transporter [Antarcticibacterium arcticum]QED36639.1 cation diffusion facilitator family transporter [Antarcticibacterium arcticum]